MRMQRLTKVPENHAKNSWLYVFSQTIEPLLRSMIKPKPGTAIRIKAFMRLRRLKWDAHRNSRSIVISSAS